MQKCFFFKIIFPTNIIRNIIIALILWNVDSFRKNIPSTFLSEEHSLKYKLKWLKNHLLYACVPWWVSLGGLCIFIMYRINPIVIEEFCKQTNLLCFMWYLKLYMYFFLSSLSRKFMRRNHSNVDLFLLLYDFLKINFSYLLTLAHDGSDLISLQDLSFPKWFLNLAV